MLEVGDKFGSYEVVKLLGQGGMGSVFLLMGTDRRLCVAKILDPATAKDHDARVRFLHEAELAQKVKSPYLVETYDVGQDPDTGLCYILMEYVPGGSLKKVLETRGKLTVEEALSYTRQIALALEEVRQYGIVHRDIKPDNIMFGAAGEIKLADLGIARSAAVHSTTITKSGVLMGTPAYMSPEQMTDPHGVDIRSDIYSLGIVLFEMIAGERPYPRATFMELMAKAVKGDELPDVRSANAEVPKSVAELIAKMSQANLARRFETPRALVEAIDVILSGEPRESKSPHINFRPLIYIACGLFAAFYGLPKFLVFLSDVIARDQEQRTRQIRRELQLENTTRVIEKPVFVAKNGQQIYVANIKGLNWYYRLNDKGEAILSNSKRDVDGHIVAVEPNLTGDLVVPADLNGHKLVRLGTEAFKAANATSITLPDCLREIGPDVFTECKNLKRIIFLGKPPEGWAKVKDVAVIVGGDDPDDRYFAYVAQTGEMVYVAEEGGYKFFYVLNDKGEAVLHHPAEDKDDRLTAIEPNPEGKIEIPAELNGHKLVRLERDSLHDLKATEIKLPNTIETIGAGAFRGCQNLTEMRFPDSVKNIDAYWMFLYCYNLRMLDLNNATGFYPVAFEAINTANIEIKINEAKSDLRYVNDYLILPANKTLVWANPKKHMNELVLPEGIERLGSYSIHDHANIEKIILPTSLMDVDADAFLSFVGDKVLFPRGLKKVAWWAFRNCRIQTILFPETLERLENECFTDTTVKRIIFRGNVPKELGKDVFKIPELKRAEILVPKSAKGWGDVKDVVLTFAEMPSVSSWKAIKSFPQATRRIISDKGAKTKKGESANVYLGRLTGFNGDYHKVVSDAVIARNGTFLVAGEEGDVIEFALKGYEKLTLVLPSAKLPQSGQLPDLGSFKLTKEGGE